MGQKVHINFKISYKNVKFIALESSLYCYSVVHFCFHEKKKKKYKNLPTDDAIRQEDAENTKKLLRKVEHSIR